MIQQVIEMEDWNSVEGNTDELNFTHRRVKEICDEMPERRRVDLEKARHFLLFLNIYFLNITNIYKMRMTILYTVIHFPQSCTAWRRPPYSHPPPLCLEVHLKHFT